MSLPAACYCHESLGKRRGERSFKEQIKSLPKDLTAPLSVGIMIFAIKSRGTRGCSSMAELQLPKLTTGVRFPSPAPPATLAQSVERIHGKDEVISSILISGSRVKPRNFSGYGVLSFIHYVFNFIFRQFGRWAAITKKPFTKRTPLCKRRKWVSHFLECPVYQASARVLPNLRQASMAAASGAA